MESADRRVSFLPCGFNKVSKFRISGFFFKSGKTKRQVDMRVCVKFLEFGNCLNNLGR